MTTYPLTLGSENYHCWIEVVPEEEGGYSALVVNLPGVGSQGETEKEALTNAQEAVVGAIGSYLEAGEAIPFIEPNPYAEHPRFLFIYAP